MHYTGTVRPRRAFLRTLLDTMLDSACFCCSLVLQQTGLAAELSMTWRSPVKSPSDGCVDGYRCAACPRLVPPVAGPL